MPKKDDNRGHSRLHTSPGTAYSHRLLTELRVTNFKALAGSHIVPLAPLTLVYGANASGKSSIIQSLLLLAQSVQANSFRAQGPLVDVRDLRHVVTAHDSSNQLTIGVRFLVEEEDNDAIMVASLADDDQPVPAICFEGGIALTFQSTDQTTSPEIRALLDVGGAVLLEPDVTQVAEGFDDEDGPWGPYFLRWKLGLGDSAVSEALAAASMDVDRHSNEARSSAALLRCAADMVRAGFAALATLECWVDPDDWGSGLDAPPRLQLSLEPAQVARPEMGPFSLEGYSLSSKDHGAINEMLKRWAAGETSRTTFNGFKSVTELFRRVEQEARGLLRSDLQREGSSLALHRYRDRREWDGRPETNLVSFGPIRPAPRRVHLDDEGFDSTGLALIRQLFRSQGLLDGVNAWLERLEIPYSVAVDQLVSKRSGVERGYSFELTDTRTNVEVSLADVGYGVSQVLPIIAECVSATRSIICIEQPELHLHPRLAANLGELLVETVSRGNQIIAETHSENILLRIQRLIREGQIAASDVAVLYVDNRSEAGATVSRLHLDDEGDLVDRWPGGFFDDRLADVLGIPS